MANITGYDSVASSVAEWRKVVPVAKPAVIGSYRNGIYANNTAARQAFPSAIHIDYDVHAVDAAACLLDVETGDASDGQAPNWVRAWLKINGHAIPLPGLYRQASSVAGLISVLLDAGFKREDILIQSAHYGIGPHICGPGECQYPQADGTQHTEGQGSAPDVNLFAPHFLGKAPVPPHDPHYDWFDDRRRWIAGGRSERAVVQSYDKYRRTQTLTSHPHRAQLAALRVQLWLLRARLVPMPEKGKFHRSWREHQLQIRGEGKRVV